MSDGPHKSLPMRPGWKRVAECADNRAFAPEEVSRALIPALEQDCREEIPPGFLDALQSTCGGLFKDQLTQQLEALRPAAGHGLGRSILEHALWHAANGETGIEAPVKAVNDALIDRAAKCSRQVEEHYHRESSQNRASDVRERLEVAVGRADIEGLSRRVLGVDAGPPPASLKQQGLDDGVKL